MLRGFTLTAAATAVTTLMIMAAACSNDEPDDRVADDSAGGDLSTYLPDSSLVDWVSYGRQVVVVEVLSERRLPTPAEDIDFEEAYAPRAVTVLIVATLWQDESYGTIAGEVELVDWGWLVTEEGLRPLTGRLEVGGRYLVPLAEINGELGSMATVSVPVEGQRIATEGGGPTRWTSTLAGMSLGELRAELAGTGPDSAALRYAHLEPVERYRAVLADRREAAGDPPVPTVSPE